MLIRSLLAKIALCIIVMEALGGLGAFLTSGAIPSWYSTLVRPSGTPPNWIFGPVWTTLYAMIGASFALIWHRSPQSLGFTRLSYVFCFQFFLNLLWTPVFFGAQNPEAALIVIVALWIAIILCIKEFRTVSPLAAFLLLPYLLWVSYATYLNAGYAYLN